MKVTLVCMPWQAMHWPSLALSVLDTVMTGEGCEVTQAYGNLAFAEYLAELDGELTPDDYHRVAADGFAYGVGEWIFTSALYRPGWREAELVAFLRERGYPGVEAAVRMHYAAPDFIAGYASRILGGEPALVGLTSAFEQNVPSLALASALKRARPGLPIVMGGPNCDGPMGAAVHRNFTQLDYVVRGEGERPVPELLQALRGERPLSRVTSLCWRDPADPARTAHANPYLPTLTPAAAIPAGDFQPFFDAVEHSPARSWIKGLALRLETSRGCWWGEKRQCTFCGLNGGAMAYRAKPPERAYAEITSAVRRFGVLDVMLSDNIIDPAYFTTLMPRLAALDWDVRIFYEVKSNLKPAEMAALAAAGVTMVQPGIESLSSHPLSLMDKGVAGAAQVRALRLFREHGIFPKWNYLYGFPGETWEAGYAHVVEQIPALVHLPPPNECGRVTLDRFAPLFDRPELGIDGPHRPAPWYAHVYDLPPSQLADLAYTFVYPDRGITSAQAARLDAAITLWGRRYETSTLDYRAVGQAVVVTDRRTGWVARDHVLEGLAAAVYLTLARHLSLNGLGAALRAGGYEAAEAELEPMLHRWLEDGLVFHDDGVWVALALPARPAQRVSRHAR